MTQEDITHFLMDTLHVQRIVWLNHGNLIGDDTDGHIDTIVRIAPDNTLLYVSCDDFQDEQYADFQALKQELVTLRTMDEKPYRLLKLPMPAPIYDEGDHLSTDKNSQGDRLPATYANFLVINDAVIYPTYHQPNKDEEARKQIQQAFPGRDVIGLDSRTIIRQHGSIHCLTMQLPKGTFNNTI